MSGCLRLLAFLSALLVAAGTGRAEGRFPGAQWEPAPAETPGWSADGIRRARDWSRRVSPTAAVMIVQHGRLVAEWGDTVTRSNLHSARKSLLSALVGIAVAEGKIDLRATIEALGIDDNPPALTAVEKQATVHDLLAARSGIYHPALYETDAMAAARPLRGSHPPGTFWYYNNWDFNVLGTIYERAAGESIFDAFERRIARPIGMEDYRPADGAYVRGADSIHPAYPIRMSARDLGRFALLYLNGGNWEGRQVVPPDWVAASTRSYSDARGGAGYAYLWWVGFADFGRVPVVRLPPGTFSAQGYRGQFAYVMPALDLVLVHRVNSDGLTDSAGVVPSLREIGRLLWLVLDAAGVPGIGPDASLAASATPRPSEAALRRALTGATLTSETRSQGRIRVTLRPDGTAEYRRGEAAAAETGTWSINGDQLCRGRSPVNRRAVCHTVLLDGSRADLYDANGLMEFATDINRD